MTNKIKSEDKTEYAVTNKISVEDQVIANAKSILAARNKRGAALVSPKNTQDYLALEFGEYEHEIFGAIMLDNRNRVIEFETLFRGTVDGASVYPREVVKSALAHNAAAMILFHNHPSGIGDPSQADIQITERLKKALALVDIRVLDHIIVAGTECVVFSERGLI